MRSKNQFHSFLFPRKRLKDIARISPILVLLLAACSPLAAPAAAAEVPPTAVEVLASPTLAPTVEASPAPSATPEAEQAYPLFLPLVTKPDLAPQTIDGVRAQIDWVYVDESRVSIHYTISGLDWPDGTIWDAMLVRITSSAIPARAYSGAGGWGSPPVEGGAMTGYSDQLLLDGALDAEKHPTVDLRVEIPLEEGPTPVGTFRFDVNVPVLDGRKLDQIDQTVVANDVSMTLKTLIFTPSYAEALLCFQMPSAVDWQLTASKLTVAGRDYPFSGTGLVAAADGNGFLVTDPERCSTVGFNIPFDESTSSITLTVPKLLGSVPEVITEERVQIANERLEAIGIQFDYENIDHGGNIVILQRPADMPDAQIYPLIWDALAEQYAGPWVFTVPIER